MLDHATNYISKKFSVEIKPTLIDFEKGSFPEILISVNNKKSSYYCFFLGNTTSNFSDTGKILSNFKEPLFSTDYLIVDNELSKLHAINKIIEYYKDNSAYELVINTPKYYNYEDSDGEYQVRWNENKKQIEGYTILKKILSSISQVLNSNLKKMKRFYFSLVKNMLKKI